MAKIDSRSLWLFGGKSSMLKDKNALIDSYFKYMMNKTIKMFEYKGLPETIPVRELELILQLFRFAIFTKVDDNLFVFYGGLGGQPNEYYQPTQAIVVNPYLRYNEVLKLDDYISKKGVKAVVTWNDSCHIGLYPLNNRYASLLAETDLTLKYMLVNMRFMNVLTGNSDADKESLEKMFKDVEDGTGYGIVVTEKFIDDTNMGKIDVQMSHSQNQLKDVIEVKQYLMGSWLNELGLNANYNMKREAINESEADLNEDSLLPMVDDMLQQRKKMCEQLNSLFGTDISVELSSSWKKIRKEIKIRENTQKEETDPKPKVSDPSPEESKDEKEETN